MASARFKQHFPFAAVALNGVALSLGDGSLAILTLAATIGLLPLAYGSDVDQIARGVRKDERDVPHVD